VTDEAYSTQIYETARSVHKILRKFRSLEKIESSEWFSKCLVTKAQETGPHLTPISAVRTVYTNALTLLKQESGDYADILQGRFWEGLSVAQMISRQRPYLCSEGRFFSMQKDAILRFTGILLEKEQECISQHQKVEDSSESNDTNTDNISNAWVMNLINSIGRFVGLSTMDVEDLKDEVENAYKNRWSKTFLALSTKVTQAWTIERVLRISTGMLLLITTWRTAYPPLQWMALSTPALWNITLIYVAASLTLPLVIGSLVNTNDDLFWQYKPAHVKKECSDFCIHRFYPWVSDRIWTYILIHIDTTSSFGRVASL
jgi:hypothetical protein